MPPQTPSVPTRVTDAVDQYLHVVTAATLTGQLARTTGANYARDLTEFTELAGPQALLAALTGADIDAVVTAYRTKPDGRYAQPKAGPDGHRKTRGEAAQARFRQSVHRLFTHATTHGWVPSNPMADTRVHPKLKAATRPRLAPVPAQAARTLLGLPALLETQRKTRGHDRPDMRLAVRDEFLLRLMVEVGPRVSEIANANRTDLAASADGSTWLRLYGRTGAHRWVPLSPDTVGLYARYLAEERPDPKPRIRKYENASHTLVAQTTKPAEDAECALVLTWRGRRMTPRDIQLMVHRMHAHLPVAVRGKITPHRLRHTAADLLLASGAADQATVDALLGQSSPQRQDSVSPTGHQPFADRVDPTRSAPWTLAAPTEAELPNPPEGAAGALHAAMAAAVHHHPLTTTTVSATTTATTTATAKDTTAKDTASHKPGTVDLS